MVEIIGMDDSEPLEGGVEAGLDPRDPASPGRSRGATSLLPSRQYFLVLLPDARGAEVAVGRRGLSCLSPGSPCAHCPWSRQLCSEMLRPPGGDPDPSPRWPHSNAGRVLSRSPLLTPAALDGPTLCGWTPRSRLAHLSLLLSSAWPQLATERAGPACGRLPALHCPET